MAKTRIAWIDIARGIGILLVVYGHALSAGQVRAVIYSFHMPLFFFLSGLVFRYRSEENVIHFIKKNAQNILGPYLLFAILSFFLWIFTKHPTHSQMMLQFGSIFYGNGNNGLLAFNNLLWFLPCLFIARVGLFCLYRSVNGMRALFIGLFGLSLIGFVYSVLFSHIKLPLGIETALSAIVFVALGSISMSKKEVIENRLAKISKSISNRKAKYLAAGICFIITVGIALVGYSLYHLQVDMRQDTLHNYLFFYLGAGTGTIAVLLVSSAIGTNRLLEYLGKQSLVIFAWHLLTFPYISKLLFYTNMKPLLSEAPRFLPPIVYSIFAILIVLCVAYPFQKLRQKVLR